ncbi:MAG TPA: hypothetical protein VJ912_04445 [Candidatus Nanoarchaeia archaeon]|nr:hypothetical protein [Candidatus Nanoarchaeia archaeon]
MAYDIYMISTYPQRKCGVGTFAENLVDSIGKNVNSVKVAPIEKKDEYNPYTYPVIKDWMIDQYNPDSWKKAAHKISSEAMDKDNSVVILQHEYGLDPKGPGDNKGYGRNFVDVSKIFNESGIMNVAYLHTVRPKPRNNSSEDEKKHYEHEKKTVRDLAKYNDGLIVTAERAIDMLVSNEYDVPQAKVEHIPHGTRNFAHRGRDETKEKYGLEGKLVFTTLGMKEPRKGVGNAITGWGNFLNNKVGVDERKNLVYIVAGGYHPNFITENDGKKLRDYQNYIKETTKKAGVKSQITNNPRELGELSKENDVVFLEPGLKESYIPEDILVDMYIMTNGMVLLYDNKDQISSGPLSDAIGSGRATIATKFPYAQEMLNPKGNYQNGIVGMDDPRARGLLVDNEKAAEQSSKCFEYLTFEHNARKKIEESASLRGSKMRWPIVGNDFLRYLDYIKNLKHQGRGKDPIFKR